MLKVQNFDYFKLSNNIIFESQFRSTVCSQNQNSLTNSFIVLFGVKDVNGLLVRPLSNNNNKRLKFHF